MTIDPIGMTFIDWASQNVLELERFGSLPRPGSELEWRDWAAAVVLLPRIVAKDPPLPDAFPTWQLWAQRLNEALG